MGEQKMASKKIPIVLGIIIVALVVVIILMFFNYIPTLESQEEARLVNVGLGARDLAKDPPYTERALHISGYICNVGEKAAYKTQLHVVAAYSTGGTAIDSYLNIGEAGVIYGVDSYKIEKDIPYSADVELGSWTLTPVWSATP
jgi:hypothetical protein